MDFMMILKAFALLGIMGGVFGLVLTFAAKKFHVETDERVAAVREVLGGANCGACGFAGCDAFAEAVVSGKAKPGGCSPAGAAGAKAIGEIMGVTVETGEKMVARVICQGHDGVAKERYEYDGYKSCRTASAIAGGPKMCRFSCIGLGDCVHECAFDAISIKNSVASIDETKCMACGACVNKCPRSAISLVPAEARVLVLCRNSDTGREARAACMKACIACRRCEKECKYGAITIENGFAHIDVEKCTRCGACVSVCPCGCIKDFEKNEEEE